MALTEFYLCQRIRLYSAGTDRITGTTTSGQHASGIRTTWTIDGAGPGLPLWETVWSTAEREVVLGRPEPIPRVPLPLAQLMGRRRATIEPGPGGARTMTVRLVLPDPEGWPRFKSCSLEDLSREVGRDHVDRLESLGVRRIGTKESILGATGRNRLELCAVLDAQSASAAPALYVVTRVLPTLRRTGLLP